MTEIGHLTKLTYLALANSFVTGVLPSELTNLTNLEYLVLVGNQLSGPFPSEIMRLSSLGYLYVARNQLTGPISRDTWKFLGGMKEAWFYDNQFTGALPDDVGEIMTKHPSFDVSTNQFTGTIPTSLELLRDLSILDLSYNQFTGTVPGNLTAEILLVHGNANLTGKVPESTCENVQERGGTIVSDCEEPVTLICTCDCTCGENFTFPPNQRK